MLDFIKGSIKSVYDDSIAVDVGAIAFRVAVPFASSHEKGKNAELHLYMHWNQEQGPSLFGFSSESEKEVFLLVISCSGVGPRLGMAVLEDLGAQAFLDAVIEENDRALSKVSGIGPKKAEQMIVHLKHKVAKLIKSGMVVQSSGKVSRIQEVSDVLKSLNYSRSEISAAMNHLGKAYSSKDLPFDKLIRHALSFLSKKRAIR